MPASPQVCPICGEPFNQLSEPVVANCESCGKEFVANTACPDGKALCEECRRKAAVNHILAACVESDSRDPVALAQELMGDGTIHPNGPEHHTLVGAALLTAYRNCGGKADIAAAFPILRERSLHVPGGACGWWGTCGAAVSAGQYWAIVSGSSPKDAPEQWAQCQRLTSRILGKLADQGGPRCCKRTGFTAILEAAAFTRELTGVKMDLPEKVSCTFSLFNRECLKERCPYFEDDTLTGAAAREVERTAEQERKVAQSMPVWE